MYLPQYNSNVFSSEGRVVSFARLEKYGSIRESVPNCQKYYHGSWLARFIRWNWQRNFYEVVL
jgi:hypothetical protein